MNLSHVQINKRGRQSRFADCRATMVLAPAVVIVLAVLVGCQVRSETLVDQTDPSLQPAAARGPVQLKTMVDRTTAHVAEKIDLTLQVNAPADVRVKFSPHLEQLGSFEVIKVTDRVDIPQGARRQSTRTYQLESLTAGPQEIPAVDVHYIQGKGQTESGTLQSRPVVVEISSLLEGQADPLKFRDIKGVFDWVDPVQRSFGWRYYAVGSTILVVLAGATLFVYQYHRRRLTPDRLALAALACLQEGDLLERGEIQKFYDDLTDIVRQYVEQHFSIQAPRLTTGEFLAQLGEKSQLEDQYRPAMEAFLRVADMVKFACLEPGQQEADAAIEKARQFVLETANTDQTTNSEKKAKVAA